MDLFCFASRSIGNIEIGVRSRQWAVATVEDSQMKGRRTKAEKYLCPGSRSILYCSPTHSFTVPFIVESKADLLGVVADIWPEIWELPFRINPLGDVSKQLHMDQAWKRWPILRKRSSRAGGVTAAMNITGVTAFVPVDVTQEDWDIILNDLATASHS